MGRSGPHLGKVLPTHELAGNFMVVIAGNPLALRGMGAKDVKRLAKLRHPHTARTCPSLHWGSPI